MIKFNLKLSVKTLSMAFAVFILFNVNNVFAKTISQKHSEMVYVNASGSVQKKTSPLKNLLMAFSTPQITANNSKYLSIKGLTWDFKQMQITHPPHFSNSGHLNISTLGRTSFELRGKNDKAESIFLNSSIPSRRFIQILNTELGHGVITKLKNCRSSYIPTQKSYQINFKNKSVIYVDADAVLSFKPTMSPPSTSFNFYLERPNNWKC